MRVIRRVEDILKQSISANETLKKKYAFKLSKQNSSEEENTSRNIVEAISSEIIERESMEDTIAMPLDYSAAR